jgi:hypothetical protein
MRRSHLTGGLVTLILLGIPLALAPWKARESLESVERSENRNPVGFPKFSSLGVLLDADTWVQVDGAVRDRMPLREDLVGLKRALERTLLQQWQFGVVGVGLDDWLFYLPSLGSQLGSLEHVQTALDRIDAFVAEEAYTARLIITLAPDKHTIYPEYMSAPLQNLVEQAAAPRELLHEWFLRSGAPQRVPLWDLFRQAKGSSMVLLYDPSGSHYSSFGSMILAKAMIDAVDPALWNPEEVTYTRTLHYQADLANLAGFTGRESDFDRFEVVRPGVELVMFAHDGVALPGQDRPLPDVHPPITGPARYINRSTGRALIGGRTLIIHDSYINGYLRPTLRQFFEDVTFVPFAAIPTSGDFLEALSDFDLVYIESAEREFIGHADTLFSPPTPPGTHLVRSLSERGFP